MSLNEIEKKLLDCGVNQTRINEILDMIREWGTDFLLKTTGIDVTDLA